MAPKQRAVPQKTGRIDTPSRIWSVQRRPAEPPECGSVALEDGAVAEDAPADSVLAAFSEAVSVHQSGRRDRAIDLYKRILSRHPNLPEVHCNLGAARADLGQWAEAESSLRQAIALKPDYPEPYGNLGMAL